MTCWEFYDEKGHRIATVYSGAVAYLLFTELTRSGMSPYITEHPV